MWGRKGPGLEQGRGVIGITVILLTVFQEAVFFLEACADSNIDKYPFLRPTIFD
jgi:hypothetical protein